MRHAPATLRNRDAILAVLLRVLPAEGLLLEIGSGTGEHAAFMAPLLPRIIWQPTDFDAAGLADMDETTAACANVRRAMALDACAREWPVGAADAIFCCNMIHIAPWAAAEGLFRGAGRVLPAGAPLILYGPFKRHGEHTAPSNAEFEEWLQARDPRNGVRCLDTEVKPLAETNGFVLDEAVEMPANNLTLVWRKA